MNQQPPGQGSILDFNRYLRGGSIKAVFLQQTFRLRANRTQTVSPYIMPNSQFMNLHSNRPNTLFCYNSSCQFLNNKAKI